VRNGIDVKQMRSRVLLVAALLSIPWASQGSAATATVRDGGTIQLGGVTYRLDGVDAPPIDQLCINELADVWTCGIEARDQLTRLVAGKQVRCDDLGADPASKKRRIGACRFEGEIASIGQSLVGKGFALNVEASAAARFGADEARAKEARQGLWRGCFVAPREFRIGRKDGALLGGACRPDRDREIRAALFPEPLMMPPGCSIKGKYAVRARVTGNLGIYHLQACRSYPGLTEPDRWFCSEEDAQAAGFRRAYNCRSAVRGK
jgi:endonuclease YncB( thermonuclease family)